jgi:adenylylsulfate kinase-like enzyme
MRTLAKTIVGADRFIEIFVHAPFEVCRQRDVKGLYAKLEAGQMENFTGAQSAYEAPQYPDLLLPTHELSLEECVQKAVTLIRNRASISA